MSIPTTIRLVASVIAVAALPVTLLAQKDIASCKTVFDAMRKVNTTPHHVYSTSGDADAKAQRTSGEIIFVGGVTYMKVGGQWSKSTLSEARLEAQEQENIKNAKSYYCKRVGDETLDGTPATAFEAFSITDAGTSHSRVLIARGTGLVLRNDGETKLAGMGGTYTISMRYDYSRVAPPDLR